MLQILRNFVILVNSNLIARLINFLASILIIKTISIDYYGLFKWYSVIISYLLLILNFGYDTYFYRLIINKKYSIEKAFAIQLKTRLIASLLIVLISFGCLWYLELPPINKQIFLIMLLDLIFYSFNIEIFYKIKNKFVFLSILVFFVSIINLILVYIFVKDSSDIINVVLISILKNFILITFLWCFSKRVIHFEISKVYMYFKKFKIKLLSAHLRQSIVISMSYFMISIYYNLDSFMLGIFRDLKDVALYSTAYNFILLAIMPTSILFSVFSPYLSKNIYRKESFIRYFVSTFLLGVFVFLFLLLSYKYLILLAYGDKYKEATNILLFLSFDIIPCYLAGALANPINLWGDYKNYLKIVSIGALGNFIGNIIAIPLYGINGAIFTTILSEVLVAIGAIIYWQKSKELLK